MSSPSPTSSLSTPTVTPIDVQTPTVASPTVSPSITSIYVPFPPPGGIPSPSQLYSRSPSATHTVTTSTPIVIFPTRISSTSPSSNTSLGAAGSSGDNQRIVWIAISGAAGAVLLTVILCVFCTTVMACIRKRRAKNKGFGDSRVRRSTLIRVSGEMKRRTADMWGVVRHHRPSTDGLEGTGNMATIGADPELGLPVPGRAYPILRDYWPTPVTSVPEAQRDDAHISWTQPAAHKPPNHDSIASTALWSQKATSGPPQASPASLRNHFAASDNPRATALYYPTLKPNNHKHASQQITTPRESMDEQTRPDGKTIDLATPISRASTSTIKASEAAPKQKVPRPHRHSSLFSEVGGPGLFLQTADSELWQDSLESAEDPTTPPKAPPKLRSVAVTPQLPPINSPGSRLSLADFQPGHHRDYFGPDARVDMPNTSPRQIDGTLPRPLSLAASTASSVGMLVAMYYNTMDRPKETPETSPNREPTSSARICARYGHEPVFNDEIEVNEGDSMLIEQVFKDGWAYGWNVRLGTRGMFPLTCLDRNFALPDGVSEISSIDMPSDPQIVPYPR